MHDKEFANVSALSAFDRYAYLCSKLADRRQVWSLRNAAGWVLAGDGEGREGVPIWPHPRFAQACAVDHWSGCEPAAISLDDWLNKWLPGMERDGRYVAAFMVPSDKERNISVEPAIHRQHLLDELSNLIDLSSSET